MVTMSYQIDTEESDMPRWRATLFDGITPLYRLYWSKAHYTRQEAECGIFDYIVTLYLPHAVNTADGGG